MVKRNYLYTHIHILYYMAQRERDRKTETTREKQCVCVSWELRGRKTIILLGKDEKVLIDEVVFESYFEGEISRELILVSKGYTSWNTKSLVMLRYYKGYNISMCLRQCHMSLKTVDSGDIIVPDLNPGADLGEVYQQLLSAIISLSI